MEGAFQPMSFRRFIDSKFSFVLPAPGGALADRGMQTNNDADAFMASLAASAKCAGTGAADLLHRQLESFASDLRFTHDIDLLIMKRIGEWLVEIA